ncbi:MAG TPA: argininosuccinate lyase [Candidatus Dormibacteraeota bacterium]|nr:argininosuccinate lyase [Candidatus Dormibacteraeota bacterium]
MTRGIRVVGAGVGEDDDRSLPEPRTPPRPPRRRATDVEAAPPPLPPAPTVPEVEEKPAPPAPAAEKAWSGRFATRTARRVEEFTSSLAFDQRLYPEDIQGSQAHARMLRSIGLITREEQKAIDAGLRDIKRELDRGEFVFDDGDEDIHMAIERRLFEVAGEVAGKLHTARSRNDQVATDLRMYGKRVCRELMLAIASLQEELTRRAQEHRLTPLPGYTHLQRAQVVSLAHHLLAYVEMLQRDIERLQDCHDRCDVLPLGSGALAATTLPIDRRVVADQLGFDHVSANSLDAVSDRDFAVEIVAACALLMTHLSRFAEELVLWTSTEFGYAELPDAYATGSSLMPQKKNPDVLELIRGRTGRVTGALVSLLTTLKGLPLAYNRDLQEDKEAIFDAVDTAQAAVVMLADVVKVVRYDVETMAAAASDPLLMATDVAEWLVVRGVPFREAHRLVGRAVRVAQRAGRTLAELSEADWASVDPRIGPEVVELFDTERSLRRREVPGGPGPRMVSRQLVRAAAMVAKTRRLVPVLAKQTSRAKEVGAGVRR